MAGAARSIDASLMSQAMEENAFIEDVFALNSSILFNTRNLSKIDCSIPQIFTDFSRDFLYTLSNTPLFSIEKATSKSILMFKLAKDENQLVTRYFTSSSVQAKRIKSDQKAIFFLLREAARNDIASAQQLSGLTVNELISLANYSNQDITKLIAANHYIFHYRGDENALKLSLLMPESENAKMMALSTLLQTDIATHEN
ncbi:hypothetical protein A9Q98_11100 [Thalassotalea sp. 42_200_T64]|nr:hypothetical protein A9Q98_11100 [Thalassotalea sp. 42_200_T64]